MFLFFIIYKVYKPNTFYHRILVLLNKRKLEKLKDKWWNQNPERQRCGKDSDQNDGISIQNIGGVFIVIFVGIGLACVTLMFEYYYYRFRPKVNVEDVAANPDAKIKPVDAVKPIVFNLRPAPTQALQLPTRFRSRF